MRAAGMAFNWSLSSARVDLRLPERQKLFFSLLPPTLFTPVLTTGNIRSQTSTEKLPRLSCPLCAEGRKDRMMVLLSACSWNGSSTEPRHGPTCERQVVFSVDAG